MVERSFSPEKGLFDVDAAFLERKSNGGQPAFRQRQVPAIAELLTSANSR